MLKHLHGRKNLGIHSDVKQGELKSRIRPKLREGEGVTIPRSDVNYVATEWGITNLFAKSIQERALRLIEITHPIFRDWLLAEAKELKYIRENYVLESKGARSVNPDIVRIWHYQNQIPGLFDRGRHHRPKTLRF